MAAQTHQATYQHRSQFGIRPNGTASRRVAHRHHMAKPDIWPCRGYTAQACKSHVWSSTLCHRLRAALMLKLGDVCMSSPFCLCVFGLSPRSNFPLYEFPAACQDILSHHLPTKASCVVWVQLLLICRRRSRRLLLACKHNISG